MNPGAVVGQGSTAFPHPPVRGSWQPLATPDDVLAVLRDGPHAGGDGGLVAAVNDAGAALLAPVFPQLVAVVSTTGTVHSHLAIVAREFGLPCLVGATLAEPLPDGAQVEVDCSQTEGVVRAL